VISHHPRSARLVRSRRRGEPGAVLVEMAFVAMFLAVLAGGAYDYGMGWRQGLAVTEAARTGARVGSSQGRLVGADFALLSGTKSALASSGVLGAVNRVVIYKADTAGGDVPANCKTTTSTNPPQSCNILTGAQFRALPATAGTGVLTATGCINNSQSKKWCPTTRNNVQLTAEYIGVWVQVTYTYQFKFLGSSQTIERDAVMRLEPTES
jgi:Flp pilus assembly protein TadG